MNDPNHKISVRQLRALLLFTATTDIVTVSALGLGAHVRETVIGYLIAAALLTFCALLARRIGRRVRLCAPIRNLFSVMGVLLLVFWIGLSFYTLHDYLGFVYGKFANTTLILVLIALGAAYGVYSGIEGIARLSSFFLGLALLVLSAAFLKAAPSLSLANLTADYDNFHLQGAGLLTAFQLLGAETILFASLRGRVRAEDDTARSFVSFVWLKALILGGTFLMLKALLGSFLQVGRFPLYAALVSNGGSSSDILSLLIVFLDLCAIAVRICACAYGVMALVHRLRRAEEEGSRA